MKLFRCECFAQVHKSDRKKLDKRSQKGVFVGYDIEEHGYKVYLQKKDQGITLCNL